jgi:methylthioribose-1-phosphate isomerase
VEPDTAESADGPAGGEAHDAARRAFFFQFGKQAVTAVGQVAGMADIVGRTSSTAAASLLGLDQPPAADARGEFTRAGYEPVSTLVPPAADDRFRSPYRLAGDELIMLDQRGLPEQLDEVVARRGSDVAYYLRIGVSRGGARMAQEAAYGLALTAAERADQPAVARSVELTRTRRTLVEARPSARLLRWSMARMEAATLAAGESASGQEVATALRAEADAIATHIQLANVAIAERLIAELPAPADRPTVVLIHGDQGALAGGLVGTATTALRGLRDRGRALRVFLTEGRPFMDGARVGSWELRQAGLEHHVITEGASAWLLEREPVDAVLLAAEWVAANGDLGAVTGSRTLALAARWAASEGEGPLVLGTALAAAIDLDTPDGAAIPGEQRPARDLTAYLAEVPVRSSDALVPAADVVPAAAIDRLLTEHGSACPASPADGADLADLAAQADYGPAR